MTNYAYDDLGRLRTRTLPQDRAGRRPVTGYAYDLRDNLVAERHPQGTVTAHEYDQRDRLRLTAQPDPDANGPLGRPVTAWEYNADDTLRREATYDANRPDVQVATQFHYDQLRPRFELSGRTRTGRDRWFRRSRGSSTTWSETRGSSRNAGVPTKSW